MSNRLPQASPARVLALGAYLKNRACLIDGDQVSWSPVHGDLGDAASRLALEQSVQRLKGAASGPVHAVAHDLHPDFYSTRLALALAAQWQVPAIAVQHHRAHCAVVMAENGLSAPVIGLALDGMGLGDDGQAWGGEVLLVGDAASGHVSQRLAHLAPLAMPGGDMAAREPWRLAAAVLHALGCGDQIEAHFAPLVGAQPARLVRTLLQRGLQCPASTSAGRWFDAAAAALGLITRQASEAEAAMALEACAQEWLKRHPDFTQPWTSLDLLPLFGELFALGIQGRAAQARGAAMFHLALANALAHHAALQARRHATRTVVLGGGCCANRILNQALTFALARHGLRVFQPLRAGCGDAGLALGQAWAAAHALQAQEALAGVMPEQNLKD